MHRKCQVLARLEEMQFFFQQQGIGAEVNVLFPEHQPFHNLLDFRMHQRFAAGDRNHRRAALVHGFEAFLGRQFLFQDVRGILNLSTARASQIAAEQGFEH